MGRMKNPATPQSSFPPVPIQDEEIEEDAACPELYPFSLVGSGEGEPHLSVHIHAK